MTGAAPVPVPPPMPAVMKAMRVPSLNIFLISSRLSSAAARAFSGRLPAPSPSLPNCRCTGTGESLSAWLSVLHSTKVTSWMPSRYMWLTALPPPPPTPTTLMILFSLSGSPKSSNTLLSIIKISPPFYSSSSIIFSPNFFRPLKALFQKEFSFLRRASSRALASASSRARRSSSSFLR